MSCLVHEDQSHLAIVGLGQLGLAKDNRICERPELRSSLIKQDISPTRPLDSPVEEPCVPQDSQTIGK